jgi:hypothetical protein
MLKRLFFVIGAAFLSFYFTGCASLSYRLVSEKEDDRTQALAEIDHLGNEDKAKAAESLKEYFLSPDSSIRGRAAEAIYRMGPEVALPVFVSVFENKHVEARTLAEQFCVKFQEKAIPYLVKALSSPDFFVRTHAIFALGDIQLTTPTDNTRS